MSVIRFEFRARVGLRRVKRLMRMRAARRRCRNVNKTAKVKTLVWLLKVPHLFRDNQGLLATTVVSTHSLGATADDEARLDVGS